jgi:hypothetical protein
MAIDVTRDRIAFLSDLCKKSVRHKQRLSQNYFQEIEMILDDDGAYELKPEFNELMDQYVNYRKIFDKQTKNADDHGIGTGKNLIGYLWTYPNINGESLSLGSGCQVCPHCGGEIKLRILKNRRPRSGYIDPNFNIMIDTNPKDRRAYFQMLKK